MPDILHRDHDNFCSSDSPTNWTTILGGVSAATAALLTHHLDVIKVHKEIYQQKRWSPSLVATMKKIEKQYGYRGLFNGISAGAVRQFTYTVVRFGFYNHLRTYLSENGSRKLSNWEKLCVAFFAGGLGAFAAVPFELVKVRMQYDVALTARDIRHRGYCDVVHGVYMVVKHEGFLQLYRGASLSCARAAIATSAQLACYEDVRLLLTKLYFYDHDKDYLVFNESFAAITTTHMTAAVICSLLTQTITHPIDVIKTRIMNEPPGTYFSIGTCARRIMIHGPLAFFRGYGPSMYRTIPLTVETLFISGLFRRFCGD